MLTPVLQQVQKGPSCGTTSLAMALSTLCQPQGEPLQAKTPAFTQHSIDKNRRLPFMYNTPQMLMKAALEQGFHAEACNKMDEKTVAKHLKAGKLILALGKWEFSKKIEPFSWHWHVLHGYEQFNKIERSTQTKSSFWNNPFSEWTSEKLKLLRKLDLNFLLYTDPNGIQSCSDFDTYKDVFWRKLKFGPFKTNVEQFGIVLSKEAPKEEKETKLAWPKTLKLIHGIYAAIHGTARFFRVKF